MKPFRLKGEPPLHHQQYGVLEDTFDLGHVEGAVAAVGDAVIRREGELHYARRDDFAVLVVVGAPRDARDGDDGRLRRVDDRGEALDAEHAHVGDGDRTPLVLVGLELALARPGGEVLGLLGDGSEALAPDIPYDGGYEPLIEGHGHCHVYLLVQLDPAGGVEGVEVRVAPEGDGARLHHEVVDRELDALLFELFVELLAQGHRRVHPDLDGGVEVRDVLLGLGHPLADDLHHPRRFDELRPWLLGRFWQAGRLEALHLGLLRLRLLWRRHAVSLPVFGPLGRPALHRCPHVALHDPARGTRAVYLREVEVVLVGQPADYGRGPEMPVGPAVGLLSSCFFLGFRFFGRLGLGSGGLRPATVFLAALFGLFFRFPAPFAALGNLLALALDKRYRLADGHVLAFVRDQLCERSLILGLELHRDLVGLDLCYWVPLGDLLALALEPLEEGALLHRVAHLGHNDFRHLLLLLVQNPTGRVDNLLLAREGHQLEVARVRPGDLGTAHPLDGCVQVVEGTILDDRRHLARHPEPPPLLLDSHGPVRLLHGLDDGVLIKRPQGSQIYDLGLEAVLC